MRWLLMPVTALLLVTATQPWAVAETKSFRDPARDAVARWDLTRVTIGNEPGSVSARAKVRNLRGGGAQVFAVLFTTNEAGVSYQARTVRRASGRIGDRLTRFDSSGANRIRCNMRSRWMLGENRVSLRFPQDCLEQTGRIRASVALGPGDGTSGDPHDWSRTTSVTYN